MRAHLFRRRCRPRRHTRHLRTRFIWRPVAVPCHFCSILVQGMARKDYLQVSKTGPAHLLYSPGDTGQGLLPAFSGLLAMLIALSPALVGAVDGACKLPLSSELEVSAGASSRIVPANTHTSPILS